MIKSRISIFGANSNSQQAVWVGISTLSSFIVGIASSVILSRYFSKEEYGTYRQIIYIYNTFLTLFAAGLPGAYAYFLPKVSRSEGKGVINRLTKLFVILGIVFSFCLFFSSGYVAELLRNPALERGLKLFSFIPLLLMPTLGIKGVYTAIRKTQILAVYTTVTRLGMLAFIVLPVIIFKGSYETAIIGWIFSSILTLILAIHLKYKPFKGEKAKVDSITSKKIMEYSLPIMVASLSGVVIKSADQFFISRYYGTETFADFSNGFIPLPFIPLIVGSMHAIFVPLFSSLIEKENGSAQIAKYWESGVNKAVILLFPLLVFFIFYAKEVVLLLYGPLYDKSYIYFRLAMVVNFSMPFVFYSILLAAGRTKLYAKIHIVYAIIIWGAGFIVCKNSTSPYYYVAFSVVLAVISKWVGLLFASKIIKGRLIRRIDFSSVARLLVICSVIGLLCKISIKYFVQELWVFLLISGIIYFGLLILCDNLFKLGILKTTFSFARKESVF